MQLEDLEERIQQLLPKLLYKDPKALEEFFQIVAPFIYYLPKRLFQFSEDELGEFFLYAYEKLRDGEKISSFKGESKFTTWFFSTVRNLAIDFLRKKQWEKVLQESLEEEPLPLLEEEKEEEEDKELIESFFHALEELPVEKRVGIKLAYYYFFDLKEEEIDYLAKKRKISRKKLLEELSSLKRMALEKAQKVRELEERINYYYYKSLYMKKLLHTFFEEHPYLPYEEEKWDEEYFHPDIPEKIIENIRKYALWKKRQKSFLEEREKRFFQLRLPMKEVAKILGEKEEGLSVRIQRILEKIVQKIPKKESKSL